jgi:hypothetical protein
MTGLLRSWLATAGVAVETATGLFPDLLRIVAEYAVCLAHRWSPVRGNSVASDTFSFAGSDLWPYGFQHTCSVSTIGETGARAFRVSFHGTFAWWLGVLRDGPSEPALASSDSVVAGQVNGWMLSVDGPVFQLVRGHAIRLKSDFSLYGIDSVVVVVGVDFIEFRPTGRPPYRICNLQNLELCAMRPFVQLCRPAGYLFASSSSSSGDCAAVIETLDL